MPQQFIILVLSAFPLFNLNVQAQNNSELPITFYGVKKGLLRFYCSMSIDSLNSNKANLICLRDFKGEILPFDVMNNSVELDFFPKPVELSLWNGLYKNGHIEIKFSDKDSTTMLLNSPALSMKRVDKNDKFIYLHNCAIGFLAWHNPQLFSESTKLTDEQANRVRNGLGWPDKEECKNMTSSAYFFLLKEKVRKLIGE